MNSRRLFLASTLLLLTVVFPFLNSAFKNATTDNNGLTVEKLKTKSGYTYTLFHQNNLKLDITLKRPDKKDHTVLLCIAGAFTDLQNLSVDGLYLEKGTVVNKEKINHSIGGALKIIHGESEIFPTNKGALLTDSYINTLVAQKGSLFQQIQLIEKGVGAKYKDVKLFQRRAIVKLKGNKTAIIESYEHITLSTFTKDLIELGALDALYTDMGAWDEGWYKTSENTVVTIGRMKTQTDKQCNWVVFKTK